MPPTRNSRSRPSTGDESNAQASSSTSASPLGPASSRSAQSRPGPGRKSGSGRDRTDSSELDDLEQDIRRNRRAGAAPTAEDVVTDRARSEGGNMAEFLSRTYMVCDMIPYGRVTSYGHIARLTGYPRHSRHVGNAMRDLPPGSRVCWQRVLSSTGHISPRHPNAVLRQKRALEAEGVIVTSTMGGGVTIDLGVDVGPGGTGGEAGGVGNARVVGGGKEKVDLKVYGWFPESVEFE